MKRAFEPPDVWTPRRLLVFQIIGFAGLIYFVVRGGWNQPLGAALFFGAGITFAIGRDTKKLLLRVERLEEEAMVRDLAARFPAAAGGDKDAEPVS